MRKIIQAGLVSFLLSALILGTTSCTAVKKRIVDSMIDRVKQEKPLTQSDLEAAAEMIRTKSTSVKLSDSRKIYVLGKVTTGLVREYSQPLAAAGFNVDRVTVADILGLLDTAGVIEKGEYDYLLGVDLAIFNPLEQETQLISQNRGSLILALAQLAFKEGFLKH